MTKSVNKRDVEQELALHRVAIGIYAQIFVPVRSEEFQPRKGTLMHDLWQGKRLTLRHQRAWQHFTVDLYNASGKSGPVVSSYGDGGSAPKTDFKLPTARVNAEYRRLERLGSTLIREESILLRDLISDEVQCPGFIKLEVLGFATNGYKDDAQARAAGAARVTCLLEKIASFYSI
jgi:hypothetical protein